MKRPLVIGIGSLIMTDDGIGTKIAEALKSRLLEYDVKVIVGETDCQYCFNEISPNDLLIIIDAMSQGKAPGEIEISPLIDALKKRVKIHTQHDFSLFDAVLMNYPNIKGYFIGIEAAEIGFGYGLSQSLELMFEKLCNDALKTILELKEAAELA